MLPVCAVPFRYDATHKDQHYALIDGDIPSIDSL
jgi:hypothetical protein